MNSSKGNLRKHLMTGISYMIPFVVSGGLMIAFAIIADNSGNAILQRYSKELMSYGGYAFKLMIPFFAAYIAYSIGDRPAIAPAAIAAFIGEDMKAGFLGALLIGLLTGYFVKTLNRVKVSEHLRSLKGIILIPLVATLFASITMRYLIGKPIVETTEYMTKHLQMLSNTHIIGLAALMGLMIAIDLGGPINKAAYAFTILAISEGLYHISGISTVGVCIPSIGVGLAVLTSPRKYTETEKTAGKASLIMGLVGVTEGAIPFAVARPLTNIPILIIGTVIGTVLAGLFKVKSMVAWGGPVALPAVTNIFGFLISVSAGSMFIALCLNIFWKQDTIKGQVENEYDIEKIELDLDED